jgi:imidazoleglycerol-phosphate dehydratase
MRQSEKSRKTTETDIRLKLNLDGKGIYDISTKIGFFDHMLELFSKHSQMDLTLSCDGDVHVDEHHTVEDCGITLGLAISEALGNKEKINRYSTQFVPMDETLVMVNLDISGRPYFMYDAEFQTKGAGDFDAQWCEEFFRALAMNAGFTLHISMLYGENTHHIIEAIFKAVARAVREAVSIDPTLEGILSTKGVL